MNGSYIIGHRLVYYVLVYCVYYVSTDNIFYARVKCSIPFNGMVYY
jgi:hypothetical protein